MFCEGLAIIFLYALPTLPTLPTHKPNVMQNIFFEYSGNFRGLPFIAFLHIIFLFNLICDVLKWSAIVVFLAVCFFSWHILTICIQPQLPPTLAPCTLPNSALSYHYYHIIASYMHKCLRLYFVSIQNIIVILY